MPNALVKKIAQKSKKSVKDIEKYWSFAVEAAEKWAEKNSIAPKSDAFWAYVTAIVKRRAGLGDKKLAERLLENIEGVMPLDNQASQKAPREESET